MWVSQRGYMHKLQRIHGVGSEYIKANYAGNQVGLQLSMSMFPIKTVTWIRMFGHYM